MLYEAEDKICMEQSAKCVIDPKTSDVEQNLIWFGHASRKPRSSTREHWTMDDIAAGQFAAMYIDQGDGEVACANIEFALISEVNGSDGTVDIKWLRPSALNKLKKGTTSADLDSRQLLTSIFTEYPEDQVKEDWPTSVPIINVVYSMEPYKTPIKRDMKCNDVMIEALMYHWRLEQNPFAEHLEGWYKRDVLLRGGKPLPTKKEIALAGGSGQPAKPSVPRTKRTAAALKEK